MLTNEDIASERSFIYRVALKYSKDKFIADDITQEAVLRGMQCLHKFKGDGSLQSWLYTITKNLWYSHLHYKRNLLDIGEFDVRCECGILEELVLSEVQDTVDDALNNMTFTKREIFISFLHEGASYKQIGKRFRLPINTVGASVKRTRDSIIKKCRMVYSK